MSQSTSRRWFQFSLRALVGLLILGTVTVAWTTMRMRRAQAQRDLVARVEDYGHVRYDWEEVAPQDRRVAGRNQKSNVRARASAGWIRRWLGPEYFQRVTDVNLSFSGLHSSTIPVVGSDSSSADDRGMAGSYEVSYALGDDPEPEAMDSILRAAGKVRTIRRLYLARCTVDDRMLAHISRLTRIEELDLEGTSVLGEGLFHLSRLKRLKWLSLRGTKITDPAMLHLREFPALERLDLSETGISGRRLGYLKSLKGLKSLSLDNCKLDDEDGFLSELSQLTSLQEFSCQNWSADAQPLGPDMNLLRPLKRLKTLDLSGIVAVNATALLDLSQLEKLTLAGSAVTDDDLKQVAAMASLRELHLERTQVTAAGVRNLLSATQLKRVWLDYTKVTRQTMLKLKYEMPAADYTRFGVTVFEGKPDFGSHFQPLISATDKLPPGWKPSPPAKNPFE